MQRHRWICSSVTPSVPSCQQRQNLNKRVTQRRKSSSNFLLIFEPESQRLPVCKRLTLSLLSFLSLFGFSFCCVSSFLWPVFPLSVFLWAFSPPGIISADQSSLMQICLSKSYIFHRPLTSHSHSSYALSLLRRLEQKPADIYSHIRTLESQIC